MKWLSRKAQTEKVPIHPVLVTVVIKNAAGEVVAVRDEQFWVRDTFVPPR